MKNGKTTVKDIKRCVCPFRVMVDIHFGDAMAECNHCKGVFPVLEETELKRRAAIVAHRLQGHTH